MTLFHDYLEGTFDNKEQALKHPTRYARITVTHKWIGGDWFEGTQSYHKREPYRQFRMRVFPDGEKFRVRNYTLNGDYKSGCDTIFEMVGNKFYGKNIDCDCWVYWKGVKTYLTNDIILGYNFYHVMDSGIEPVTGKKLWGSQWGHLEFKRQTSSAGQSNGFVNRRSTVQVRCLAFHFCGIGDATDMSDRGSIPLTSIHGGAMVQTGYKERD